MAKMNKKWVILCSTAIGAIYTAGYLTTETQASLQQPQQSTLQQPQHSSLQQPLQSSLQQPQQSGKPAVQGSSSPSKSQYKNGTFKGSGRNRRGSIQVAVSIKNDKITDVEISNFAMHYSVDDVVGLPQEVVKNQSAHVRNVSGATYSTQAFQDAVQEALTQARNS